jgi:hypothetical protein
MLLVYSYLLWNKNLIYHLQLKYIFVFIYLFLVVHCFYYNFYNSFIGLFMYLFYSFLKKIFYMILSLN